MRGLPSSTTPKSLVSDWQVTVQVWKGNDVRHLGYFEDEVEAARAYDRAVLDLRGADTPTNFPASDYGVLAGGGGSPRGSSMHSTDDHGIAAALHGLGSGQESHSDMQELPYPDSLFLGVSWDNNHGSWRAELWDGKEYALLGHFDSEEAAARAYDRACLKQHGNVANTNYPAYEYETESAAAALLSARQHLSGSDEEDHGDLEMSALQGRLQAVP